MADEVVFSENTRQQLLQAADRLTDAAVAQRDPGYRALIGSLGSDGAVLGSAGIAAAQGLVAELLRAVQAGADPGDVLLGMCGGAGAALDARGSFALQRTLGDAADDPGDGPALLAVEQGDARGDKATGIQIVRRFVASLSTEATRESSAEVRGVLLNALALATLLLSGSPPALDALGADAAAAPRGPADAPGLSFDGRAYLSAPPGAPAEPAPGSAFGRTLAASIRDAGSREGSILRDGSGLLDLAVVDGHAVLRAGFSAGTHETIRDPLPLLRDAWVRYVGSLDFDGERTALHLQRDGRVVAQRSFAAGPPRHLGTRLPHFDGQSTWLELPALPGSPQLTVALWARSDTPTWNATGCLLGKPGVFRLQPNAGTSTMVFLVHGGGWTGVSESVACPEEWHHYAGTYDGERVSLYVDGCLVASAPFQAELDADALPLLLGKHPSKPERHFAGSVADLRLFSRALSDSELRGRMRSAQDPADPDLLGCWPLADGDLAGLGQTPSAVAHGALAATPQAVRHPAPRAPDDPEAFAGWRLGEGLCASLRDLRVAPRALAPAGAEDELAPHEWAAAWPLRAGAGRLHPEPDPHHAGGSPPGEEPEVPLPELEPARFTPVQVVPFAGGGQHVAVNRGLPGLSDAVTVEFWARGGPGLPRDGTLFSATNGGGRVLNIHVPLASGQVVWDAGNHGATYDRTERPATTSLPALPALSFDGNNQHVEVPGFANPTEALTLGFWARSNQATWGEGGLISKRDAFVVHPCPGSPHVELWVWLGGWEKVFVVSPPSVDVWHHYAFTFDGTRFAGFLDGAEVTSRELPGSVGADEGPLFFAHDEGFANRYLAGAMAEVTLWERALSSAEVEGLARATPPEDAPGLVGSWLLEARPGELAGAAEDALCLRGGEDHLRLPAATWDFAGGLTLETWARWDAFSNQGCIVDAASAQGADHIILHNLQQSSTLRFQVWHAGQAHVLDAPDALELGRWMHLAATVDPQGQARLYRDGVLLIEGPLTLPPTVERTSNLIGRSHWWPGDEPFQGALAELRLWSRARSVEELCADAPRRLSGSEPDLLGSWSLALSEQAGQRVAEDRSPQGAHALVHGSPQPCPPPQPPRIVDRSPRQRHARIHGAPGPDERPARELPAPELYRGAWTHWAFVKDATQGVMSILRNGETWHRVTGKTLGFEPVTWITIGGYLNYSWPWEGALAELRVWSRARDEAETQAEMHLRARGDEAGLVACWPLDAITEVEGRPTVADIAGGHADPIHRVSATETVEDLPLAPERVAP